MFLFCEGMQYPENIVILSGVLGEIVTFAKCNIKTGEMKKLLSVIAAIVALCGVVSCSDGAGGGAVSEQDSAEVSFLPSDSVVYGLAGSECTDSVLDFIQVGQDPKFFDIIEARKLGNIIGDFETGDHVAVVFSADKKQVVKAVDISSLVGRWVKDSVDTDSLAVGFSLFSDGSAGSISHPNSGQHYTGWTVADANLVLTRREIMNNEAKPEYDTFFIVRLQKDTLVLRRLGEREAIKYVYKEFTENEK